MPECSVLVCVGPGTREVNRLADLLDSVQTHEGSRCHTIVINDEPGRDLKHMADIVIDNPRAGRGCGWGAGLTMGILSGFKLFHEIASTQRFILKLDTDSLVIAPFIDSICRFFQVTKADAAGCFKWYPHRIRNKPEDRSPSPAVKKLAAKLTVWKRTPLGRRPYLQCWLRKHDRDIAKVIRDAITHGYILGEYVCGGGYAISTEAIRDLSGSGRLANEQKWLRTPLGEDITVTLLLKSIGKIIIDFCGPEGVFGVGDPNLPFAPDALIQSGYSVVHPVKCESEQAEDSLRRQFKNQSRD